MGERRIPGAQSSVVRKVPFSSEGERGGCAWPPRPRSETGPGGCSPCAGRSQRARGKRGEAEAQGGLRPPTDSRAWGAAPAPCAWCAPGRSRAWAGGQREAGRWARRLSPHHGVPRAPWRRRRVLPRRGECCPLLGSRMPPWGLDFWVDARDFSCSSSVAPGRCLWVALLGSFLPAPLPTETPNP